MPGACAITGLALVSALATATPAGAHAAHPANSEQTRTAQAVAAGGGGEGAPIALHPWKGPFPVGVAKPWTLRRHTLTVVPTYSSATPDPAQLTSVVRAAATFWEQQIPGIRITTRILKPVKLPAGQACTSAANYTAAAKASGISHPQQGQHIAAVALACPNSGLGSVGGGRIYAGGTDPQTLAHEFGHNLSLMHANTVTCTSGGEPVTLSKTCKQREYADPGDVMGAAYGADPVGEPGSYAWPTIGRDITLGGVGQAVLSGRVRTAPAGKPSTITVATSGRGTRAALVNTKYGPVMLTARAASEATARPNGVQAQLATQEGSGLLTLPSPDGSLPEGQYDLQLGDSWNIEGSPLRVTVTRLSAAGATLAFTPVTRPGPAPIAPTITTPTSGTLPGYDPYDLTWTPSPAAVAYHVEQDGIVIARLPAGTTTLRVDAPSGLTTMRVQAIGANGQRAASTPIDLDVTYGE
jgi:hypothetical protein